MPEHLRALIVILVLASIVFAFARRPATDIISSTDFVRRRNLWFGLTLLAFLSHSFWIYAAIAFIVLLVSRLQEKNPVALFFFLLFLIPSVSTEIPGFGLINYLLALNHVRLLALAVLLPAFLVLWQRPGTLPFGRTWPDKLLAGYLVLVAMLYLRETSLTDTLRQGLYLFIDVFLPYYVVSRALRNMAGFKDALFSLVIAVLLLAIIGVFEMLRHWLLYSALLAALDLKSGFTNYLGRIDLLRASASTGHSIALGYVITVAIGFYLFLQEGVRSKIHRCLGALLLVAGLFAPLARGPWLGAAALISVYIATGRAALKRLMVLGLVGLLSLPLLAILPGGQKVLDLLPFVGAIEAGNITYRERLIDNSLIVIQRNPWLGSIDYRSTPEMEAMRQGQGIIDIVNTYIAVTLESGLVGLSLFIGFFAAVLLGIRKAMRSLRDKEDEMHRLGRSLLATLIGILVMIFTVSSVTIIPVVYWSVAGLGVAYAQMVRERMKTANG